VRPPDARVAPRADHGPPADVDDGDAAGPGGTAVEGREHVSGGAAERAARWIVALTGRRDIAARLWGVVERLDDDAERRMDRDDRARFERVLAPAERQAGRALDDEAAVELLRAVSGELDAAAG
jgi:hypothetical protein